MKLRCLEVQQRKLDESNRGNDSHEYKFKYNYKGLSRNEIMEVIISAIENLPDDGMYRAPDAEERRVLRWDDPLCVRWKLWNVLATLLGDLTPIDLEDYTEPDSEASIYLPGFQQTATIGRSNAFCRDGKSHPLHRKRKRDNSNDNSTAKTLFQSKCFWWPDTILSPHQLGDFVPGLTEAAAGRLLCSLGREKDLLLDAEKLGALAELPGYGHLWSLIDMDDFANEALEEEVCLADGYNNLDEDDVEEEEEEEEMVVADGDYSEDISGIVSTKNSTDQLLEVDAKGDKVTETERKRLKSFIENICKTSGNTDEFLPFQQKSSAVAYEDYTKEIEALEIELVRICQGEALRCLPGDYWPNKSDPAFADAFSVKAGACMTSDCMHFSTQNEKKTHCSSPYFITEKNRYIHLGPALQQLLAFQALAYAHLKGQDSIFCSRAIQILFQHQYDAAQSLLWLQQRGINIIRSIRLSSLIYATDCDSNIYMSSPIKVASMENVSYLIGNDNTFAYRPV